MPIQVNLIAPNYLLFGNRTVTAATSIRRARSLESRSQSFPENVFSLVTFAERGIDFFAAKSSLQLTP